MHELGYKRINLELNSDESVSSILEKATISEMVKQNILLKPEKNVLDQETTEWYQVLKRHPFTQGVANLLRDFNNEPEWQVSFIDILCAEMFKQPGQSLELTATLEKLKPKREEKFANEMIQSAQDCEGGTITVIGNNHYTVDSKIKKNDSQFMPSALFIALSQFVPYIAPIKPAFLKDIEQYRKSSYELNISNRKKMLNDYFEESDFYSLSLTEERQIAIIDALLNRIIEKKISSLKSPQPSADLLAPSH